METENNIIEEDEESCSDMSESQFEVKSSKMSGISSEFHVKTTFKQILGRGALAAISSDQNRRD
jgi:hypothetical protein